MAHLHDRQLPDHTIGWIDFGSNPNHYQNLNIVEFLPLGYMGGFTLSVCQFCGVLKHIFLPAGYYGSKPITMNTSLPHDHRCRISHYWLKDV